MAEIRVANRVVADGSPATVPTTPAISILTALLRSGLRVRHDCGGKALCGTCRFCAKEGAAALSPILPREAARLAAVGAADGEHRLACQARAYRDVVIELSL